MNIATIKKYTKKDGSIAYQFQAYLGIDPLTGKKRFTTKHGFKSLQEAKIALNRLEYEVNTLGVLTSKPKIMTFKQVSELWLENYKLTVKESTFFTQKNAIKNHIYPNFAELKIDKITPEYCQKVANKWHSYLKKFLREKSLPKITIHGFRHTHCSLLFEAGASIKEVQYRLGHSDIKTTMDIYAHVTERAKNQTADKFACYVNF